MLREVLRVGPAPVRRRAPTTDPRVLPGYGVEHQHFLRQWVPSRAHHIARTDEPAVIRYALDNFVTEFAGGPDVPSHYELLLRMGEGLGIGRDRVLATPPLPATRRSIARWEEIARCGPWVEANEVAGDRRGRRCTAAFGTARFHCVVAFHPEGKIRQFRAEPGP